MLLWWVIFFGVCFGGNGILIGVFVNVVLVGIGNKYGYFIFFKEYFKIGFLFMIIFIIIFIVYLIIKF